MRDIKFRVWDKELEQYSNWTNRDPFFCITTGKLFFWERTRNEDGSYGGDIILEDLSNRFLLEQYTGLKDKNGKEIYEGDIIKYDNHKDPVTVRWTDESHDYHPALILADLFTQHGPFQIVGNIHENKELLK